MIVSLSEATLLQIHFLRDKLYETESTIQAGLGRYTWQTLNIKCFCESCEKFLKSLSAIVVQIGIMGRDIRTKVSKLESYSLFEFEKDSKKGLNDERVATAMPVILKSSKLGKSSETPDNLDNVDVKPRKKNVRIVDRDDGIKPCLEYFKSLELERNDKTNRIQKLYDSIGPSMIKLESLILGSFTGESDKMSFYYTHWEKEMFSALMRFTTRNLQDFSESLMQSEVMFEVDAVLAAPEITMKPTSNEIYNIMVHSVKDFLERYANNRSADVFFFFLQLPWLLFDEERSKSEQRACEQASVPKESLDCSLSCFASHPL
jgi:dynein heavy chain, axonemal